MNNLFSSADIVTLFYMALSYLFGAFTAALLAHHQHWTINCKHDWNIWGEPIDGQQYRQCSKCKMVERRFL